MNNVDSKKWCHKKNGGLFFSSKEKSIRWEVQVWKEVIRDPGFLYLSVLSVYDFEF